MGNETSQELSNNPPVPTSLEVPSSKLAVENNIPNPREGHAATTISLGTNNSNNNNSNSDNNNNANIPNNGILIFGGGVNNAETGPKQFNDLFALDPGNDLIIICRIK